MPELNARQFYGRDPDEVGRIGAQEFMQRFEPNEDPTWAHTAARVRRTARYADIVPSIAEHGIHNPVAVRNTWTANGHHRVIAAFDSGQDVPYELYRIDYA